jgi:riboflavin transporter FmnP
MGSTYWRKKDNEKAEIFQKIEPYLTFLNIPQLERKGADLQTRIDELQIIPFNIYIYCILTVVFLFLLYIYYSIIS